MGRKLMVALLPLALLLSSCAAHVNHPGTANTFDSDTFDTLLVTDSVIQSTKVAYLNNQFPSSIAPQVKNALNDLIAAYDVANTFYCGATIQGTSSTLQCTPNSYHSLAMAGSAAAAAQQTAVQNAITNMNTKVTALANAKAGK